MTEKDYDWLAAFCRRERNSLHYDSRQQQHAVPGAVYVPGDAAAQHTIGYTTAIDGMTERLIRELRTDYKDFDEARFRALIAAASELCPGTFFVDSSARFSYKRI